MTYFPLGVKNKPQLGKVDHDICIRRLSFRPAVQMDTVVAETMEQVIKLIDGVIASQDIRAEALQSFPDLLVQNEGQVPVPDRLGNVADTGVAQLQMLREHYWEVMDRETAERYWAIRP